MDIAVSAALSAVLVTISTSIGCSSWKDANLKMSSEHCVSIV